MQIPATQLSYLTKRKPRLKSRWVVSKFCTFSCQVGPDNEWHIVSVVCLFFTNHPKNDLFIFCDSHDGQQCYDFHLYKNTISLQFIWQCPSVPPFLHIVHMHLPIPTDTTTLISSNQTNCPQTASYNLGTNLPKMSLQFSCHISMLCALCYNAPALKSLLELISMNQIRKSEVWRIHGNKWWTWKDPYLIFEYKSNFNWCSIKNLWQNVDWLII